MLCCIDRKLVSAAASQRTRILPLLSCGDSDSPAVAALGHVAVAWGLSLMAVLLIACLIVHVPSCTALLGCRTPVVLLLQAAVC